MTATQELEPLAEAGEFVTELRQDGLYYWTIFRDGLPWLCGWCGTTSREACRAEALWYLSFRDSL